MAVRPNQFDLAPENFSIRASEMPAIRQPLTRVIRSKLYGEGSEGMRHAPSRKAGKRQRNRRITPISVTAVKAAKILANKRSSRTTAEPKPKEASAASASSSRRAGSLHRAFMWRRLVRTSSAPLTRRGGHLIRTRQGRERLGAKAAPCVGTVVWHMTCKSRSRNSAMSDWSGDARQSWDLERLARHRARKPGYRVHWSRRRKAPDNVASSC
jgi:hypothetical protein